MQYLFDWDPNKDRVNVRKHRMSFRQASTVFRDARHLSIPDTEHSEGEERWITLGLDLLGILRVVVHTIEEQDSNTWRIRIISARRATRAEQRCYREDG